MEDEGWHSRWAELRGDGGLTSKHWRSRFAAVQSLLSLTDRSFCMDGAPLTELLDLLLFSLALSDTHVLVRNAAVQCAGKFLGMFHDHLSAAELDQYLSVLLALSIDDEVELQKAAADALCRGHMVLGSQWFKEMTARLLYKFVSSALHSTITEGRMAKGTYFGGVRTLFDMSIMVPALEGIIGVGISNSTSILEAVHSDIAPHLVLLVVAVSASLLNECEISRDRTGASQVTSLLRVLGSSKYRQHVIFMISSQLYTGTALARWHKISAFLGEELVHVLEKMDALVILKGVYVAVEKEIAISDSLYKGLRDADMENVEVGALRHIIENLQIPPALVVKLSETNDTMSEENFIKHSYYHLKIADVIMKCISSDKICDDIVQGFVLSCAVLASRDDKHLSWITRDVQELANGIMEQLGAILTEDQNLPQVQTAKVGAAASTGVEGLMLSILPNLTSKFKDSLRDHLRDNDVMDYERHSITGNLATAIIASCQLCWCSKQIRHPRLSQLCTIIMPYALMALDHYSPHVKRQGMNLFIHLTGNLNPSELRWYRDAVLDCLIRNIVGCGELWPLVVQAAIPLVVCIEGKNPRSKWYRNMLNEMLGELERHQLDASYIKVWLENVDQLLEAMGLVLVAHLKGLLRLLFVWVHRADDSTVLLVLKVLKVIIKQTWPRIPCHVERFWNELAIVYKESVDKKEGVGDLHLNRYGLIV